MITTRSRSNKESKFERTEIATCSDDKDNVSVADNYSRKYFEENSGETLKSQEKENETHRIKHRNEQTN